MLIPTWIQRWALITELCVGCFKTFTEVPHGNVCPKINYSVCPISDSHPAVTVASAERSFSKLKLIKIYLRSTVTQGRLDWLSLLAVERDAAQKLDIDSIIDKFANTKTLVKKFN